MVTTVVAGNLLVNLVIRSGQVVRVFKEKMRMDRERMMRELEQKYLSLDNLKSLKENELIKQEMERRQVHGRDIVEVKPIVFYEDERLSSTSSSSEEKGVIQPPVRPETKSDESEVIEDQISPDPYTGNIILIPQSSFH